MPFKRIPLARKNLTHDPRRLAAACAGIAFAVLLMFAQVGFENALFSSQVRLIAALKGDIFITSRARFALAAEKRFPITLLDQARMCDGVQSAYPVYSEWTTSVLKNLTKGIEKKSRKGYRIRSIGFRLDDEVFDPAVLGGAAEQLRAPQTALIDVKSKSPHFAFPMDNLTQLAASPAELAGKQVQLVGVFDLGADFVHDGNLVLSADNFANYFPHRNRGGDPLAAVDIGVVHHGPNQDARELCAKIRQRLGNNVYVETRQEFEDRERSFWGTSTPIGLVFLAGKLIGFVVGIVICYQVIFSDISDHLPEFATLKAMGYGADYFTRLIVVEALWLAILGFVPGALASTIMYVCLASVTGLHMTMTIDCLLVVLGITLGMCVISGLLAVRKLLTADPAALF